MEIKKLSKYIGHTSSSHGLTLVELLVAVVLASIVIIFAGRALILQTRISSRSEAIVRSQDSWNRISFLINQDIEEARCIKEPEMGEGTTLTLSMSHSCEDIAEDASLDTVDIQYSINDDGHLERRGPPIKGDGSLDFDFNCDGEDEETKCTSIVSSWVEDFRVARMNDWRVEYSLTITDPTEIPFPPRTTSTHVRTRIID